MPQRRQSRLSPADASAVTGGRGGQTAGPRFGERLGGRTRVIVARWLARPAHRRRQRAPGNGAETTGCSMPSNSVSAVESGIDSS